MSRAQKYAVKRIHTLVRGESSSWEHPSDALDPPGDAPRTMYGVTIGKDKDPSRWDFVGVMRRVARVACASAARLGRVAEEEDV